MNFQKTWYINFIFGLSHFPQFFCFSRRWRRRRISYNY